MVLLNNLPLDLHSCYLPHLKSSLGTWGRMNKSSGYLRNVSPNLNV